MGMVQFMNDSTKVLGVCMVIFPHFFCYFDTAKMQKNVTNLLFLERLNTLK